MVEILIPASPRNHKLAAINATEVPILSFTGRARVRYVGMQVSRSLDRAKKQLHGNEFKGDKNTSVGNCQSPFNKIKDSDGVWLWRVASGIQLEAYLIILHVDQLDPSQK